MSLTAEMLRQEFLNGMDVPWPIFAARLFGGVILTGLIGFERETQDRPAGLRTHMLVGLAAVCYSMTTIELLSRQYDDHVQMDPIRLVEAVTNGVAFLAAGLIVFAKGEVRGLTTGASLWLAASIGLAVGLGLWLQGLVVTALALFIVRILGQMEQSMKSKGSSGR